MPWGPPPPPGPVPPVPPLPPSSGQQPLMRRSRPSNKAPVVLLVLAPILFIVGMAIAAIGVVVAVDRVVDEFGNAFDVDDGLLASADVPGTVTVTLPAGDYQLLAVGADLTVTRDDTDVGRDVEVRTFDEPAVTVSGPDGPVAVRPDTLDFRVSTPDEDAVSIGEFEVTSPGEHTIEVSGEPSDVDRVGVRERADIGELVAATAGGGVLVVVGVTMVILAFGIGLAGLIWLIVNSSRR